MTCVNESTGTKIVSGIFIALVLILSMGLAEECRVRGMCAGPAMFAGQAGPVATGVPPPASFRFRG